MFSKLNIQFTEHSVLYCPPAAFSCYSNISTQDFACLNSCTGWYADVEYSKDTDLINDPQVAAIIEEYQKYKYKYARNVVFDGAQKSYGRLVKKLI